MKNWSEVDNATLRKLFHEEKLSYRKIADRFEDATIGKVAGRCRTLGLIRGTSKTIGARRPGRGRVAEPAAPKTTQPAPAPKSKVIVMSVVAMRQETQKKPFVKGEVRLEDLQSMSCRWPFGDPRDANFGFCGVDRVGCGPYCAEHTLKAFNPSAKKGKWK